MAGSRRFFEITCCLVVFYQSLVVAQMRNVKSDTFDSTSVGICKTEFLLCQQYVAAVYCL
jgi:hypothetical protein